MLIEKPKTNNKAFSILEIIVVLVIVSVMLAYAIPGYQTYINRTKQRDVHTQLILLHGALKVYDAKNRFYIKNGTWDKAYLNNTLGINLTSPGVTFRYINPNGLGENYRACAIWAPDGINDFTLRLRHHSINTTGSTHNPCCLSGCYSNLFPACGSGPGCPP